MPVFDNLAEIAAQFEAQAKRAFNSQTSAYTLRASARHAGECWAWEQAAKVLREAKFRTVPVQVEFAIPSGERVTREVLAQFTFIGGEYAIAAYTERLLILLLGQASGPVLTGTVVGREV